MLSFEDIRDIVSGKAPDSLVRQVRIPDPLPPHGLGLEYDAVAYAVAKGYYPVDILDPEVAKRYQASMDSEEREPFLSKRIETYESRESISSEQPEVDGIPPISPWRNIMKGRYAGEIDAKGLPYLAMLVLRAAVIKYPNLIKRVNNPASIQDAIDLSNLVYRGELPEPQDYGWAGEGLRDYRIPIDCLPVPPKDVILKLSDAWSYYVSAWNILGGYGIEGLKYDHSHLELAYRNGKYTPDLKMLEEAEWIKE
ncbi:hypothetical protein GGI07_003694 [Coemansia sp. Benny D115]|nr:hypothetical protein GGI07_003694 [Coemansia sp. Benny D115]